MESIDNQLILIEKYNLTAEEVLMIGLLFLASSEERHPEYLVKYCSLTKPDLRNILLSLQEKGIITKKFKIPEKGTKFDPETVEFNKNFLHNYKKYSNELGIQFFNTYPSIAIINGTEAPLKNYAKKFNDEDDFFFAYGKSIGWKQENHDKVIELVKWGKENNCNLLNMNIADFVISKMWNSIEELKNGDAVMKFDNITSI